MSAALTRTVRFVNVPKPYPKTKFANITFKILRFLHPPFGLDPVQVIYEVSNPEPNFSYIIATLICFSTILLAILTGYAYRKYRAEKTVKEQKLEDCKKSQDILHTKKIYEEQILRFNTHDWLSDSSSTSDIVIGDNKDVKINQKEDEACPEETQDAPPNLEKTEELCMPKFEQVLGNPSDDPITLCNE